MHTELKLNHLKSDTLLLQYVERRLNFALSRFGSRIGRVTARIGATSGTSPEVRCHMTLELQPFGFLDTEAVDTDVYAAIDRCAWRLARRCESAHGRLRSERSRRLSIRTGSMPIAG